MAKEGAIGGNISVGGNVTGAALTSGTNNTVAVTYTGADAAERQRVSEALAAIRAELARLPGAKAPVAAALAGTAADAANKEQPDKEQVGNFLDTALKTARESAQFADVAAKLLPHIQTAANWLGGQWANLVGLLR